MLLRSCMVKFLPNFFCALSHGNPTTKLSGFFSIVFRDEIEHFLARVINRVGLVIIVMYHFS